MAKGKNRYKMTEVIEFEHPWVNNPDVKFNADGLYHVDGRVKGKYAQTFREELDEAVDAAFDELTADLTAGERKKWTKYVPYEVEEDDEGNPTGFILFKFKQNAKIKLKDGSIKDVKIGIYDANGDDASVLVYSGTTGRIMYTARAIKMVSSKQAGVRLDFSGVQIATLATGSGPRFGKIDGGFVASKAAPADEDEGGGADTDTGGDY